MGLQFMQMPQPGTAGVNAGIEGLSNTLSRAAQMDLQRQQQAAQNLLRQKEVDVESRRLQAEQDRAKVTQQREDRVTKQQEAKDYAEGVKTVRHHLSKVDQLGRPNADYDPDYAIALARAHGIDLRQLQEDQQTIGQQPITGPGPQPGPGPGGGAAGPAQPAAPPAMNQDDTNAMEEGAAAGPAAVQPPPLAQASQFAQQLADHPAQVAQHATLVDQAKQARQGGAPGPGAQPGYPVFGGKGPNGEELRFDSGAGMRSLQGEREELAASGLQAADQMSPMAGKKVKDLVPLVRAGLMKPDDFRAALTSMMQMENQSEIAQGHDAARIAAVKARKGAGGAGGGGFNLKTEKQNETELAHIGSEAEKFRKSSGLDKSVPAYTDLAKAEHELSLTNNPQTQIGVVDRLVRANTGGKATIGQIRIQLSHMGGAGAELEGWLEGKKTGQLGPQQLATLKSAISAAKEATKAEIGNAHEDFVRTRFSGADYGQKGNWENAHEQLFGQVVDGQGKPVFATQHDPNAPTIVRGSGRRSSTTVGVNAKAAPAGNPLVTAARVSKLPPADQQLAQQAQARVQANPNDAVAKRWLEAHGL